MLCRNKDIVLIFIVAFIGFHFFLYLDPKTMKPNELETFNRAVDAVLSFASLATAFLFFTVSFIPVMAEKSPLFKNLKTDVKVLERIMLDSFLFFLTSIMSLIFVFMEMFATLGWQFIHTIWLALIATSLFGMLDIFIDLFKNINKEIKK